MSVDKDNKIRDAIASLDQASGTFDPASSPATGGYQLIKGDGGADWTEKKRFGTRFTILEGHGRYAGKFIVKGEGTNKTVSSYAEAYELVQELLKW